MDRRSENILPLVQPILRKGCMLAQAESGTKFRGLEEGEKLNQSLANKHFVQLISVDKRVQLIIYEARNGDL